MKFIPKLGDIVWFANGSIDYIEGKVVHIFEWGNREQYVIEYDTGIDYDLEVRDAQTVTNGPNKHLQLYWDILGEYK